MEYQLSAPQPIPDSHNELFAAAAAAADDE